MCSISRDPVMIVAGLTRTDAAPSAGALSGREPFAGLRDTREFRKEAGRNRLA